jgi:hypothetical protein
MPRSSSRTPASSLSRWGILVVISIQLTNKSHSIGIVFSMICKDIHEDILPPLMGNQVLSCLVDPSNLVGLMNNINRLLGS